MIGAAVCGWPAVAVIGNQEGVGLARRMTPLCTEPSPVKSNTTAAHDRLGGVVAALATQKKEQPHA